MIAQALMSAWLLTFTLSLDDVVLSAFLSGPGSTTMPLVLFSRARLGLNPSVNAVATLIVAVVAIGVLAAGYGLEVLGPFLFTAALIMTALLELLVLQRFKMQTGERHAVATLARYGIVIVGVLLAFSSIGIGWSKVLAGVRKAYQRVPGARSDFWW